MRACVAMVGPLVGFMVVCCVSTVADGSSFFWWVHCFCARLLACLVGWSVGSSVAWLVVMVIGLAGGMRCISISISPICLINTIFETIRNNNTITTTY